MEELEKYQLFERQINYIENERLKQFAEYAIKKVPDYFFVIPASSTGKFHPQYALGEHGLLRHVKAAVNIANDLLHRTIMYDKVFDDNTKDNIIIALLFHDCLKSGNPEEKYTRADHPRLAAEFIQELYDKWSEIEDDTAPSFFAPRLILSHMGQWNTDYRWHKEILPKPEQEDELFVHLCDYLASRKYLEFIFEEYKI